MATDRPCDGGVALPLQYGIWYTWYVIYTEQRAKHEIGNWTAAKFPLDVWGLDMNCEPGPPTFLLCCRCCYCCAWLVTDCRACTGWVRGDTQGEMSALAPVPPAVTPRASVYAALNPQAGRCRRAAHTSTITRTWTCSPASPPERAAQTPGRRRRTSGLIISSL